MDPIMKAWMFHNWAEDYNEENKMLENQGILIGSFIDPELAKRIIGKDDGETHTSTEEEFEETWKNFFEDKPEESQGPKRKRRKRKIEG